MATRSNHDIKRPNAPVEYTKETAHELVKCAKDCIYFVRNYVKIVHPKRGAIPFDLYDFQEDILRMYQSSRYNISMQSRQTGKSQTACAFLLWAAIFTDNIEILIASNKNKGAMEMIKRIRFMYTHLPDWLKPGINESYWNKHELAWDNGSIIYSEATTEDTARGKALRYIYCDEFAFVDNNIAEEFWTSIAPTLSTGGSCIITSTPNGDKNLFAQLWFGALANANGFAHRFVAWDQVPGRDEKFKEEQIAKIGLLKWQQEYECQMVSSDPMLFDSKMLLGYKKDAPLKIDHFGVHWYEKIQQGGRYLVGVDPATGTGSDFSAIQVFSFPELTQVAEYRSNTTSSSLLYDILKRILILLENNRCNTYFSCENNGIGEAMLTLYDMDEDLPENAEFISESGKNRKGFTTTNRTKLKSCIMLKELFETLKLKIHSEQTLTEFKSFILKGKSYQAKAGATDDLVSAILVIIRILDEISLYEEGIYDKIYKHSSSDEFALEQYNNDEEYYADIIIISTPVNLDNVQNVGTFTNPNNPFTFDPWGGMF